MGDNGSLYGAKVAGEVHKELRRLGGVTPPREFVLMDRAAVGLCSVFMHLHAEINWHRKFHDLIRNLDVDALDRKSAVSGQGVYSRVILGGRANIEKHNE